MKKKRKRTKKSVVCKGCVFLCYVESMPPVCLAGAYFVDGALRKKIDLKGVSRAEDKNRNNNCKRRKAVSIRAFQLKSWLKRDCELREMKYYGGNIRKYQVSEEKGYKDNGQENVRKKIIHRKKETSGEEKGREKKKDPGEITAE